MSQKHIEQFERMKRWHNRLKEVISKTEHDRESDYYEDIVYAFFQNCFHLKDWLLNSGDVIDPQEVNNFIESHDEMKICRDICNISKHLSINKPSIDSNTKIASKHIELNLGSGVPTIAIAYEIEVNGKKYSAYELATKCLELWDQFLKDREKPISDLEIQKEKMYINASKGLNVRSTPEIKDNNVIDVLKYNKEVLVGEKSDKWFNIKYDGKTGWVSGFYLSEESPERKEEIKVVDDNMNSLLPNFKPREVNLTGSENTLKVRKIIRDEFGGGVNKYPLQCTEYVQYKIQQILGVTIQWPSDRPRHGGKWANIFEKNGLYKILDKPKAGCAMSFTAGLGTANEYGHIAFVEAVYDDESIDISEANWPPPGKYYERKLSKTEWQDKYKGKFIDFT
jgi:surface antigen